MSNNALPTHSSGSSLSSARSFQSDEFKYIVRKNSNVNFDDYIELLAAGIKLASDVISLEQCTARYAMSLFQIYFPPDSWTLTPQWITQNQKKPDLAIETITSRPDGHRTFYRKVMVEFKRQEKDQSKNVEDAKVQLVSSMPQEFGAGYHSKGLNILVCGKSWVFLEYNLIDCGRNRRNQPLARVEIYPLTAKKATPGREQRSFPHVNEKFTSIWPGGGLEKYTMDIVKDFQDISKILYWICKTRGNEVRSFGSGVLASEDPSSDLQKRIRDLRRVTSESMFDLVHFNNKLKDELDSLYGVEGNTAFGDGSE